MLHAHVDPHVLDWFQDPSLDPFEPVIELAADVFEMAADTRRYLQGKAFDFGWWYMRYPLMESTERIDDYFCPSDAWGCWIPGLIVGTIGMAAGWSPLFVMTLMAYTNPWTIGPALALDAYNIYRYFD